MNVKGRVELPCFRSFLSFSVVFFYSIHFNSLGLLENGNMQSIHLYASVCFVRLKYILYV